MCCSCNSAGLHVPWVPWVAGQGGGKGGAGSAPPETAKAEEVEKEEAAQSRAASRHGTGPLEKPPFGAVPHRLFAPDVFRGLPNGPDPKVGCLAVLFGLFLFLPGH